MCAARFALLFCCLTFNALALAQQSPAPAVPAGYSTSQQTDPTVLPPVTKDPSAVSLATQALATAGGNAAFSAISDYSTTGNVTYYLDSDKDLQGSVTIRGRGLNQIRIDATLPTGVRSEITDGLTTIKSEDGSVRQIHAQPPFDPARLALPYLQLSSGLNGQGRSLIDKGIVDVDGHPAHDIQVRHILAGVLTENRAMSDYLTVDLFVDTASLQIVMMRDILPKHEVREFRYTDYRLINGVSIPFSISSSINGQKMWLINLSEFSLNAGLKDSDFQL
jgi:hypothetical protein